MITRLRSLVEYGKLYLTLIHGSGWFSQIGHSSRLLEFFYGTLSFWPKVPI